MKAIIGITAGGLIGAFFGNLGLIFGAVFGYLICSLIAQKEFGYITGSPLSPNSDDNSFNYVDSMHFSDGSETIINPATGLIMIGDIDGLDLDGNPYGSDVYDDSLSNTAILFDGNLEDLDSDCFDNDGFENNGFDDENSSFSNYSCEMDDDWV